MRGLGDGWAVKIRFVRPDGSRTGATRVAGSSGPALGSPYVGLDRDGNAVVSWTAVDTSTPYDFWQSFVRRVSRSGRLGPVRRLSPTTTNADEPVLAVAPDGRALFASGPFDDPSRSGALLTRRSRLVPGPRLTAAGYPVGVPVACQDGTFAGVFVYDDDVAVLRIPRDLRASARVVTRDLTAPVVAALGACDASSSVHLLIWTNPKRGQPAGDSTLRARTWRRGGRLTPLVRISPRHQDVYAASVSPDNHGRAEVSWLNVAGGAWHVYLRRWSDSGRVGAVHDLGRTGVPPSGNVVPVAPALTVDGRGRGVVAWERPRTGAPTRFDLVARAVRPDGSVARLTLVGKGATEGAVAGLPDVRARLFYVAHGLLVRTGP
jgi:hypothetical protein